MVTRTQTAFEFTNTEVDYPNFKDYAEVTEEELSVLIDGVFGSNKA